MERNETDSLITTPVLDLRWLVLSSVTVWSVYRTRLPSRLPALVLFAQMPSLPCSLLAASRLAQLRVPCHAHPSFNAPVLRHGRLTDTDILVLSQITLPFIFIKETVHPIPFRSKLFFVETFCFSLSVVAQIIKNIPRPGNHSGY